MLHMSEYSRNNGIAKAQKCSYLKTFLERFPMMMPASNTSRKCAFRAASPLHQVRVERRNTTASLAGWPTLAITAGHISPLAGTIFELHTR